MENLTYFVTLNPWCSFFTLTTIFLGLKNIYSNVLDKEYNKAILSIATLSLCAFVVHMISAKALADLVHIYPLIYILLLLMIDSLLVFIDKHSNKQTQEKVIN